MRFYCIAARNLGSPQPYLFRVDHVAGALQLPYGISPTPFFTMGALQLPYGSSPTTAPLRPFLSVTQTRNDENSHPFTNGPATRTTPGNASTILSGPEFIPG